MDWDSYGGGEARWWAYAYGVTSATQPLNRGVYTWDYTYDYANKLTQVEENNSTIGEYVYDGEGKRIQKTENSITTTYIYSGRNNIFEENSTGSACYIYGPTGLIAKRTTINQETNTYFYHKDHLGSTRSVTNSSKDIIVASTYHPFGETEVEEGSEKYLYNGKEKDSTGLYYYGARYYDPEVGRFATRDALKGRLINSQTLNRYSYCVNNPAKYIDLWGKDYSPADQQVEDYLLGNDNQTDDSDDDLTSPPEIIGDPYYENGRITIPTKDGDVTVFDAHNKEESNNGRGGSWNQWEEKALLNRFKKLEENRKKAKYLREMAKELEGLAKYYQNHANALSSLGNAAGIIAGYLGILGAISIYTCVGGLFFWGLAGIATGFTVGLSFASNHIGNEAQDLRDHAEQLRDQAAIDGGG